MKKVTLGNALKFVRRHSRRIGQQTVYAVLLLVNSFGQKETPAWAKRIIVGLIGYLLAPFDAIPDLSPIVGFTDDFGVLTFGLVTIAAYITDDVRINSRKQVKTLFGELDLEAMQAVDAHL